MAGERRLTPAEREAWWRENRDRYRTLDQEDPEPRTGGVEDPRVPPSRPGILLRQWQRELDDLRTTREDRARERERRRLEANRQRRERRVRDQNQRRKR